MTDATPEIDGRTRHYGGFYGVDALPEDDGRPLAVLWGNCQAEAIRQLLAAAPSAPLRTVRIPPVHEIEATDLPHLEGLVGQAQVLFAQPVADGYRGMPLGCDEVATLLPEGGELIRWPVLFDAAVYPFQVLVRQPDAGDPPMVPYHDLRTLIEAATGTRPATPTDPEPYRVLAQLSQEALAKREEANDTLRVSDALDDRSGGQFHTINHPGNPILMCTAQRMQEAVGGVADVVEPDRVLLRSVLTPHEPEVFDALGLEPEDGREQWLLDGKEVSDDEVRAAHLEFYRQYPGFVEQGLTRHARTIEILGLA